MCLSCNEWTNKICYRYTIFTHKKNKIPENETGDCHVERKIKLNRKKQIFYVFSHVENLDLKIYN
jgi:hypothetical protein